MAATDTIRVKWREDGSCTTLARMTARDATGEWTGVAGEGNWLKQADLSAITCAIFDLDSATPSTALSTPTVTIATAIQDTPVTNGKIWAEDSIGYNFLHDLAATAFPTGGRNYRVEYKFTTTGSAVSWAVFEGPASEVRTS